MDLETESAATLSYVSRVLAIIVLLFHSGVHLFLGALQTCVCVYVLISIPTGCFFHACNAAPKTTKLTLLAFWKIYCVVHNFFH